MLREYLDGSLMKYTHRHVQGHPNSTSATPIRQAQQSKQTRHSVLTVASDMTLAHLLKPHDLVLSLLSSSKGTLRRADDCFPDPKAVMAAWMGKEAATGELRVTDYDSV